MDEQTWTPMIGLKRALWRLVIRSVVALVVWTGLVWLATPVLNFLIPHWAMLGVIALVLAAPGTAIGYGLWRKLPDIAGMSGFLIAGLAVVFGFAVVMGGVMLANALRPLGEWQYVFTIFGTTLWLAVWIIRSALVED
jgi:hypothetical protein